MAKGDAMARSAELLTALETGRCRIAGFLPTLEDQAVTWEAGKHQPDRPAAVMVAFDVLARPTGQQWGFVTPIDTMRRACEGPDATTAELDAPPHRRLTDAPAFVGAQGAYSRP